MGRRLWGTAGGVTRPVMACGSRSWRAAVVRSSRARGGDGAGTMEQRPAEEKTRAWEGRPGEGSNVQYSPSQSKPQFLHAKPVLSDTASTEDRQRLRQGQRETRTLELANWSFPLVVCGACACSACCRRCMRLL